MPSTSIVTVVAWDIVPIVEITGGSAVFILVITNDRIGDTAKLSKEGRYAIPVPKLGISALFINIAQVQEHIRIPCRNAVGNFRVLTTSPIACSSHNQWSPCY